MRVVHTYRNKDQVVIPVEFEFNSWASQSEGRVVGSRYMTKSGVITGFKFVHVSKLLDKISAGGMDVLKVKTLKLNCMISALNSNASFNKPLMFELNGYSYVEKIHVNFQAGDLLVVTADAVAGQGTVVLSGRLGAVNESDTLVNEE